MQEKRLNAILSPFHTLRRLVLGAAGLLALGAGAADGFTLVAPGARARVVVGADEPEYVFRAAQDLRARTPRRKRLRAAPARTAHGNLTT